MQNVTLSDREKEVLHLITEELDCKEIAEKLKISYHTVQSHRRNLFRKIKAKSIIGLVNYAHKNKIV